MKSSIPVVSVELSTPAGEYLAWKCSKVELTAVKGTIEITPAVGMYLNIDQPTRIILSYDGNRFAYRLKNASANLSHGRLIVLAEAIHRIGERSESSMGGRRAEDLQNADFSHPPVKGSTT
jgi:hypothetical protein